MRPFARPGAAALVLLGLLGGCHDWEALSSGYRADLSSRSDGPPTDGAPADQAPDAATSSCSWTGSFTLDPPQPVAGVGSTANEMGPFIAADGLTLYFASDRNSPSSFDLFAATRGAPTQQFKEVTPLVDINTVGQETKLALSTDALTAYVAAEWSGGPGLSDIWHATRSSTLVAFRRADFKPVPGVNTANHQYDPFPSSDGLRLYFASLDPAGGAGAMDVLFVERDTPAGGFTGATALPGINTSYDDDGPALTADERLIVFGSDRPGSAGGKNLWYAVRADSDSTFSTPQPVPGVNSDQEDMNPFVSADGCEVYFNSTRPGGGGFHLYRSRYVHSAP